MDRDNIMKQFLALQKQEEQRLRQEVEQKKAAIRRLTKGMTLPELLANYRKMYKENYGVYYSPLYQKQLKACWERGIPENVTPMFERSRTLYESLDEINKLLANKSYTFKYKLPGDPDVKIWSSHKADKAR